MRGSMMWLMSIIAAAPGCDSSADGIVEYRPSEAVDRLEYVELTGDDTGLVGDFATVGDTIFLLDRTGSVAIVERREGRLRLAGHFGRSGPGPGELLRPTSMAYVGDAIAVIDGARLQYFSVSGELLASVPLSLPCPMMLPTVEASSTGLFIAGGCFGDGAAADTMKSVLAWSADTTSWQVIADAPRYTRDGTLGTIFGARSLLTAGNAGEHAFGGGESNCIWSVDDTGAQPTATEHCPVVTALYSAEPTRELRARIRATRIPGITVRWPDFLPPYLDRFVTDRGIVLLRPYSTDSLVLQLAGAAPIDIAVAPLNGLLGCKADGCIWLRDDTESPAMIVLDRAGIERRIATALGSDGAAASGTIGS